jgi:hypothetical protein
MTLRNMVNTLHVPCIIKIRDLNNEHVCTCSSASKGVIPYLDLEVTEWFVYYLQNERNTICVLLDCDSILFDKNTEETNNDETN